MKSTKSVPVVYDYKRVSEYLLEVYKYRKRHEPSFSYDRWAQEMGIKSRSYLRYIVLGEKEVSLQALPNLLQALNLNDDEASFFVNLVNFELAPNDKIRGIYMKEIFRRWTTRIKELPIENFAEFLADPIIPQLFTYLSFEDAPHAISQWSQDLDCSPERLQEALRFLIWQKLVDGRISENGDIIYRAAAPFFAVPSIAANKNLREFHRQGIKQAEAALEKDPSHRKAYSTFVALSSEQYMKAQEIIEDFNKKILALFEEKNIHGKRIYRLNQQLIPLSEVVQGVPLAEGSC